MKVFSKTILTLALTGMAIGVTGHAQEIPASSVTGTYRAGPGFVLPADVCTSTNNKCITGESLPTAIAPLIANQSTIGGWRFQISGYSTWFTGTGSYTSATGRFSGSLICDPSLYGAACGSGGNHWCGSDASCAWSYGYGYDYSGYSYNYVVGAAALPIISVTKQW